MDRRIRYSAKQAVENIRKWILEPNDDEKDENWDNDSDNSDADVDADEEAVCMPNPDADSGSERDDKVEENNDTDSCLSGNDDDDNESSNSNDDNQNCSAGPSSAPTAGASMDSGNYVARSGRVWSKLAPPVARAAAVNVVTQASGPTKPEEEIQTALAALQAFMDDKICDRTIKHLTRKDF